VKQKEQKIRNVIVGTPSYDGKLDVWYVNSLIETMRLCAANGINVNPFSISYDAMIQRARNDIVKMALQVGVDDLVFIDADMEWKPQDFIRLLSHNVDLVAGTARKKTDAAELYAVRILEGSNDLIIDKKTGLIEVGGVGCAFTRMTNRCMEMLWKKAPKYKDDNRGGESRLIFNVTVENGALCSEDTSMCNLWRSLKQKVWFDYKITCGHIGTKKYEGNFEAWMMRQAVRTT